MQPLPTSTVAASPSGLRFHRPRDPPAFTPLPGGPDSGRNGNRRIKWSIHRLGRATAHTSLVAGLTGRAIGIVGVVAPRHRRAYSFLAGIQAFKELTISGVDTARPARCCIRCGLTLARIQRPRSLCDAGRISVRAVLGAGVVRETRRCKGQYEADNHARFAHGFSCDVLSFSNLPRSSGPAKTRRRTAAKLRCRLA